MACILVRVPYPVRIDAEGNTHHVTCHGVAGCVVYRDDEDRATFLRFLADEIERSKWRCLAYSLLGNHYHLLITLTKSSLSRGFQRLNGRYARAYNRRHRRRGTLWDRRFHDTLVESEAHFLEVTRYIALNAPRANICRVAEEWPWCSYGSTVGYYGPDPLVDEDAILGLFGDDAKTARRRYRQFVEEGDRRARRSQIRIRDVSETGEQRGGFVVQQAVRRHDRPAGL
jgi:REP element-mobilizing transposase RayT